MLIAVILAAQVAGAAAAQASSAGCRDAEVRAIAAAESMMQRGDDPLWVEAGDVWRRPAAGKVCDAVLLVRVLCGAGTRRGNWRPSAATARDWRP